MVPRPAAVTETVFPSLPTRLMPIIGTFADPAVSTAKPGAGQTKNEQERSQCYRKSYRKSYPKCYRVYTPQKKSGA